MNKHFINNQLVAAGLLAATVFAPAVHAVDGVLEISAACAIFGCVNGDTSGFPVSITESGSYRLTSNLSTTDPNATLIEVTTDNVSIDLNGFILSGPAVCTGNPISCTSSGTGNGIDAGSQDNIIVRNGTVRGMGDAGIRVRNNALVENVIINSNGGPGLAAGALTTGGVFRRLSVISNGGIGVGAFIGSHYLMDSVVLNNGAEGVFGIFCGNVLMLGNDSGDACTAIAPNRCDTATDCD